MFGGGRPRYQPVSAAAPARDPRQLLVLPRGGTHDRGAPDLPGYATANPGTPVSLVVNRATPWELGACCPFVSETFAVPWNLNDMTTNSVVVPKLEVPAEPQSQMNRAQQNTTNLNPSSCGDS